MPLKLLHFFCDCVLSNQGFSHPWGKLRLNDERGLLSARQPVMVHCENLCKRRGNSWSKPSLGCPLPWSPRIHSHQRELLDLLQSLEDGVCESGNTRQTLLP